MGVGEEPRGLRSVRERSILFNVCLFSSLRLVVTHKIRGVYTRLKWRARHAPVHWCEKLRWCCGVVRVGCGRHGGAEQGGKTGGSGLLESRLDAGMAWKFNPTRVVVIVPPRVEKVGVHTSISHTPVSHEATLRAKGSCRGTHNQRK